MEQHLLMLEYVCIYCCNCMYELSENEYKARPHIHMLSSVCLSHLFLFFIFYY
jgi:hypothetical protein